MTYFKWTYETRLRIGSATWIRRPLLRHSDYLLPDHTWKCEQRLCGYGFDHPRYLSNTDSVPGVYAITVCGASHYTKSGGCVLLSEHVLYIGSSMNVYKRLTSNHPVWRRGTLPMRVRIFRTENYRQAEAQLIRTLRPWFNLHHNG